MKEQSEPLDKMFSREFSEFRAEPPPEIKAQVFKKIKYFNLMNRYKIIFLFSILSVAVVITSVMAFYIYSEGTNNNSGISILSAGENISVRHLLATENTVESAEQCNKPTKGGKLNSGPGTFTNGSSTGKESFYPDENSEVKDKTIAADQKSSGTAQTYNPAKNNGQAVTNKNTHNGLDNQNKHHNLTAQNMNWGNNTGLTDQKLSTENPDMIGQTNTLKNNYGNILPGLMNRKKISENMQELIPQVLQSTIASGSYKSRSMSWSLGIGAGLGLYQSVILLENDNTSSDKQQQLNHKQSFPSYFVNISARGEKKNFFFDMGLSLTNFSEKWTEEQLLYNQSQNQQINWSNQYFVYDTTQYWHYFYVSDTNIRIIDSVWSDQIDSTIFNIYDTIYTVQFDTMHNVVLKNSYTFLEIPLLLGWKFNMGRYGLSLSTGPIVSMLIASSGKIPYNSMEVNELIPASRQFKQFSLALSWQLNANLNYKISERLQFEIGPYYRYCILPFKSNEKKYLIRPHNLGIQTGFRFNL